MSLFDIAIIVIVILCLTRGIFRGIIKETVSLVGVFAGFYIAGKHHLALGNMLFARIWDTTYAEVVAFLAILFAMILIPYSYNGTSLQSTDYVASFPGSESDLQMRTNPGYVKRAGAPPGVRLRGSGPPG